MNCIMQLILLLDAQTQAIGGIHGLLRYCLRYPDLHAAAHQSTLEMTGIPRVLNSVAANAASHLSTAGST